MSMARLAEPLYERTWIERRCAEAMSRGAYDRTAAISGRRVRCLSASAKLVVRQHEFEARGGTIPARPLLAVSRLWERVVAEAAAQTLPAEAHTTLLERHHELLERWRAEVGLAH